MNKVARRTLVPLIALIMVPVLVLNAFAFSWSYKGTFSGVSNYGEKYSGTYSASMNAVPASVDISLAVSEEDYIGPVRIDGGVSITVTMYYKGDETGYKEISFSAIGPSHTWHLQSPVVGTELTKVTCKFYYMGCLVTTHTVKALLS